MRGEPLKNFFDEETFARRKNLKVAVSDPNNEPSRQFLRALEDNGHSALPMGLEQAIALLEKGEIDFLVNGATDSRLFASSIERWAKKAAPKAFLSGVSVLESAAAERLLFVTDGIFSLRPDLAEKVSILGNAAKLAKSCGVEQPNAAAIAAVEKVDPVHQPATVEAAVLSKMSQLGQFKGFFVDGPLALDIAMSSRAGEIKGVKSPVAGQADILLAPDLEAARFMEETLIYCAGARFGRVILGGPVPIAFNHPFDAAEARMNSLFLASLN